MSAAWVRPFRLTPMPRLRLACFPHAGGSASFFRSWSERLPPDIDLLALQYPGREDRFNEAPTTRLEDLADGAALALRDFADAPLALFGHSLGAALAYETALRLESAGAPLRHLFVSAHPAPHRQRGGALHRGDEAALLEDVRRQGGASELLEDADLRALFLPILRADYQAIETYRRAQPIALACALALPALPAQAAERAWSYSYNALGLIERADGPRTDVQDVTLYAYDSRGNLTQVTNALGQVTRLGDYDERGKPGSITDANGVTSSLA